MTWQKAVNTGGNVIGMKWLSSAQVVLNYSCNVARKGLTEGRRLEGFKQITN